MAPAQRATGDRVILPIAPGLVRIDQWIRIRGREIGTDASGPLCIYADVHVAGGPGGVAYLQAGTTIPAPRRFSIFLPPFALVQARLERCTIATRALACRPPRGLIPASALLLPSSGASFPESMSDVLACLDRPGVVEITRAVSPRRTAARVKALIDATYDQAQPITSLAAALNVAPATLSRSFRRAFGLPPVRYRHLLRVVDSLQRLAGGDAPAVVGQDVGFDDLGRFYNVFRRLACATPGTYRPAASRNAKTRA